MKWQTGTQYLLSLTPLLGLVYGAPSCSTVYGSISSKTVPTRTSTVTSTVIRTSVVEGDITTVSETYTYLSVVGKMTVTVPTGKDFTALTHAPTLSTSSSSARVRRHAIHPAAARSEPAAPASAATTTTSFPKSVVCKTTLRRTTTTTTTTFDGVESYTYTYILTTKTTTVATSTAYAACQRTDNVIDYFHGHHLGQALGGPGGTSGNNVCGDGYSGGSVECLNARTCCEAAQRGGHVGFQYRNASRNCQLIGNYTFYSGYSGEDIYYGNGPRLSGYFGGQFPGFD